MKTVISDGGRKEAGFLNERNDCTVRATAMVMGVSYKAAHIKIAKLGRKERRGFYFSQIAKNIGLEIRLEFANRTLAKVIPMLTCGRFVVHHRGHVFAVLDGVVHDMAEPKNRARAKTVYELKNDLTKTIE
jgi:hypothetical protein